MARTAEERRVKGGHQRRALPAGGDVATPEIGDDGHAGPLGNACRIVELQRPAFIGAVAQRLAVHTRCDHIRRGNSGPAECGNDRVRVRVSQCIGDTHRARELVVAGALQREQLRGKVARERNMHCRKKSARPSRGGPEVRDDGIDTVHAGAGHYAGVNMAHDGDRGGTCLRLVHTLGESANRP
jgi:hypothetical protein